MKKLKNEEVIAPVEGPKTYDEKVSDYEEHFDNLGMSDPGTEARIAAMENPPIRSDGTELDRAPELIARDEVRESHAKDLQGGVAGTTGKFGQIPTERKAMNERLSGEMTDRKEHDEHEQDLQEKGLKANIDRGGSEEALVEGTGKDARRKLGRI